METEEMPAKENGQPETLLTAEIAEAMGISQPAFEEVQGIVGRMPTVQELSTLLAMWDANGRQQSLYGWLKGQRHAVERHEYLYAGTDEAHKTIREPRVKECAALAVAVMAAVPRTQDDAVPFAKGTLLYMVGNINTAFLNSEYARSCLHIVDDPVRMASAAAEQEYMELILDSLIGGGVIATRRAVAEGGLFAALVRGCCGGAAGQPARRCGFDILTCREIRLDAFLFGEEPGRYVVSLAEREDDLFLRKMDEARVNCCFLGHVTKGRVLVDDMDFGDIATYL